MRKEVVGRMDRKVGPRATQGVWLQLLQGESINRFCFVVTKFKREISRPESPVGLMCVMAGDAHGWLPISSTVGVPPRGNLGEECRLWGPAAFSPARLALPANGVILDKLPNPSVPLFLHL